MLCFDWCFVSIVDAKAANFQIIPLKFVFRAERLCKTEKQIMTSLTKSRSSEASRKSTDSNRRACSPYFWTLASWRGDKNGENGWVNVHSTLWSFGDCADNAQNVNAILSPRPSLRHPWKSIPISISRQEAQEILSHAQARMPMFGQA